MPWTARPWPPAPARPCRPGWPRPWRESPALEIRRLNFVGGAPITQPGMKKLFVKTYGCQMNAYDSAKMADLLAPLGYAATDAPETADMVILNTCHVREKA